MGRKYNLGEKKHYNNELHLVLASHSYQRHKYHIIFICTIWMANLNQCVK